MADPGKDGERSNRRHQCCLAPLFGALLIRRRRELFLPSSSVGSGGRFGKPRQASPTDTLQLVWREKF
eukprot:scaffold758_cov177-Amphora_coffeaeformis.AAC.1